jgi:pullulanase/glycogen debranching enzyme
VVQVILDVVFNHTAEGNEKGPTLSFRGLDNRVYYMLAPLGEYYNYRSVCHLLSSSVFGFVALLHLFQHVI